MRAGPAIVWLPGSDARSAADVFVDLPWDARPGDAARALTTDIGIFISAQFGGLPRAPRVRLAARGVRRFEPAAEDGRVWIETPWIDVPSGRIVDGSSVALPASIGDTAIALVASDGGASRDSRCWSLPAMDAWPPARRLFRWCVAGPGAAIVGRAARDALGVVRLVPTAPSSDRAGVLGTRGEVADLVPRLARLVDLDRSDLRLGVVDDRWWIWSRHGLAQDFPAVGRPLRNLAGSIEPLLVPRDRRIDPAFTPAQWRRRVGLDEGDGAIWWDDADGERFVRFRNTALRRLDRAVLAEVEL